MAVDLLILLLLAACLYPLQLTRPLGRGIRPDYLSVESGRSLRGALSLGILLHHLGQQKMGRIVLPLFPKIGYLLVAVFFFLSGYGLMKQHMAKESYRRSFFARRLPAILLPYALATVLYGLLYAALGEPWSVRQILRGLVDDNPMVSASWYILAILFFYCAFGCLMWLFGRRFAWMLPGGAVFLAGYLFLCVKLDYGYWWYNTTPALLLGMTWAVYQEKIDGLLRKQFLGVAGVAVCLFVAIYGGKLLLNPYISTLLARTVLTWCVSALFVCCVVLALTQVRFSSRFLAWMGDISLEIYLYQFFFLQLFRSRVIYLENDLVYVAVVVTSILGGAKLLHGLSRKLLRR